MADILRTGLAVLALGALLGTGTSGCAGPVPPGVRKPPRTAAAPCPGCSAPGRAQRWRQDIAYLARRLPAVRGAGLGTVTPAAWNAAAARLEAVVPRLTDYQVIIGMSLMVAMLHDDETLVEFPPAPVFAFDAQQFGDGLYLLAVPPAGRELLGARLLAIDGQPGHGPRRHDHRR